MTEKIPGDQPISRVIHVDQHGTKVTTCDHCQYSFWPEDSPAGFTLNLGPVGSISDETNNPVSIENLIAIVKQRVAIRSETGGVPEYGDIQVMLEEIQSKLVTVAGRENYLRETAFADPVEITDKMIEDQIMEDRDMLDRFLDGDLSMLQHMVNFLKLKHAAVKDPHLLVNRFKFQMLNMFPDCPISPTYVARRKEPMNEAVDETPAGFFPKQSPFALKLTDAIHTVLNIDPDVTDSAAANDKESFDILYSAVKERCRDIPDADLLHALTGELMKFGAMEGG